MSVLVKTSVTVPCKCGARFSVPKSAIGKEGRVIRCRRCSRRIKVRRPVRDSAMAVRRSSARDAGPAGGEREQLTSQMRKLALRTAMSVVGLIGAAVVAVLLLLVAKSAVSRTAAYFALAVGVGGILTLAIVAGVFSLMWLYHAWKFAELENKEAKPLRTVLLLLIPVFGAVWAFFAFGRLGQKMQELAEKHGAGDAKVPVNLGWAIPVLSLPALIPVVGRWFSMLQAVAYFGFMHQINKSAESITKHAS